MALITASLFTSHIPAVGAAFDLGKTKEDYWKPVFAGYDFDKEWVKTHKPDVIFLVYNDHATAFSLQMIPTFAIMTGPEFNPADEGYGARPVPTVIGHPELIDVSGAGAMRERSVTLSARGRALLKHS